MTKRLFPQYQRFGLFMAMALFMTLMLAACGDNTATPVPATTAAATKAATTAAATTTSAATTSAAATTAVATTAGATTAATAGGASVSKSGFKGTLSYWALGYAPGANTGFSKSTDAAVAAFTKANPDIKVEVVGYTADQAGFAKIVNAVQAGSGVDAFRIPNDSLPVLVKQGAVAPIDEYITDADRSDILPGLLDTVKFDGKYYAWPLWVPPVAMYLNVDIFKEKGVDLPKEGWTYDQFVEIAKKLTFTRANGEKVYGYSALVDPGLVDTWPFILSDGARPLSADNTKYTFNTPEGISGLKKVTDLALVHKVTPPDFGTQKLDDILTAMQKKLQAMWSRPSGDSATLKANGLNFQIIHMPIGKSGKAVSAGGIGLIAVAANKDKARLSASMDLVKYLTSAGVEKDVPGYYLAPAARKAVTVQEPFSFFAPIAPTAWITPSLPAWTQIRTLIHPNLQNAIFGKMTAEDALGQPTVEVNKLLAAQ
ncbi:sugar ABC transporter substrate-binding protein [Candidatus Chlorohelix sp.]|uniref:ABC transporter substrate-binding protein n=1 Tax=Candidatus Chlorohelix sp. TaxID=3139201 RepID=UPI003036E120